METAPAPEIDVETIRTGSSQWIDSAIDYLPRIGFALLALALAVILARLLSKYATRFAQQRISNQTIANLAASLVSIVIIISGAVIALRILNLDDAVTSVLAGAGIIGLALGFAFQDVAANFLSGIIIATQKPFRVGDIVETNGVFGTVRHIELRMTEIKTLTGQIVFIPNRDILLNVLTDFSSLSRRRVDLTIGVSYQEDLEQVEQVALAAINSLDMVSPPEPTLYYHEFADSSINFDIRFWIKYDGQPKYLRARSEAIKAIKTAFDQAGITIPFPITTVKLDQKR